METKGYAVVLIEVGAATRKRLELLDQARRQADLLGPLGIRAKRWQTNRRYRRVGHLRLAFPTQALARAYGERLDRLGEPKLRWRLMRNPGSYPM
jgi:hypothetical protein